MQTHNRPQWNWMAVNVCLNRFAASVCVSECFFFFLCPEFLLSDITKQSLACQLWLQFSLCTMISKSMELTWILPFLVLFFFCFFFFGVWVCWRAHAWHLLESWMFQHKMTDLLNSASSLLVTNRIGRKNERSKREIEKVRHIKRNIYIWLHAQGDT